MNELMIQRKRKRRAFCVSSGRHLSCRKQARGFTKLGVKNKKLGVKGSQIFSLLAPYFLLLTIFSGCVVPIPIFVPSHFELPAAAGSSRESIYISGRYTWRIIVADPPVVAEECGRSDRVGCVRPDFTVLMVNLLAVELHECGHIADLEASDLRSWPTQDQNDPIAFSFLERVMPRSFHAPARAKPCGEDVIYSGVEGVGNENGGRLMVVEEWEHRFSNRRSGDE